MSLGTSEANVIAERNRQRLIEGFSDDRDDGYTNGELATGAAFYALPPDHPVFETDESTKLWPFASPAKFATDGSIDGRLRELEKAGAMILAEMDRLKRRRANLEQERMREAAKRDAMFEASRFVRSADDGTGVHPDFGNPPEGVSLVALADAHGFECATLLVEEDPSAPEGLAEAIAERGEHDLREWHPVCYASDLSRPWRLVSIGFEETGEAVALFVRPKVPGPMLWK